MNNTAAFKYDKVCNYTNEMKKDEKYEKKINKFAQ